MFQGQNAVFSSSQRGASPLPPALPWTPLKHEKTRGKRRGGRIVRVWGLFGSLWGSSGPLWAPLGLSGREKTR